MALQHLRSSTADKRPTPGAMSDGQLAMNTQTDSPGLFFKDSNGDLVKVGPVHVGATAPNASPAAGGQSGNSTGEQWLDTSGSNPLLKVWNGSSWQTVQPVASGTVVSTADTGSVTSTMIANGTIVDADVNASAAIAGTKISPNFGSQNVTTTGTSTAASFIPTSSTVPTNGVYLPAANSVALSTNGVQRINIEADGDINIDSGGVFYDATNNRLAIGTTTVNADLHVYDSDGDAEIRITSNSSNQAILRFGNTVDQTLGSIRFDSPTDSLQFYGLNDAERMRIDSSGRLLVGTSTGDAIVTVKENASGGNGATLRLRNDFGNAGSAVRFLGTTNQFCSAGFSVVADDGGGGTGNGNYLSFYNCSSGSTTSTERMRITSNGKLYLNTTADIYDANNKLHVEGTRAAILKGTGGANQETFTVWNNATSGTIYQVVFRDGTAGDLRGSITTNASSTAYNTSSDYRLKENVTAVTDGITRLQQLKPSRFNFIADPAKTVDGFIAHEVQTVVPEAITGEKDAVDADGNPEYQGIDQSKLVPLLTAALQEAIGEIESLKARVAALETP